jgi:predicted PurR-regulated permease PerM
MRERASALLARARQRIRLAAEHDPHGWHHAHLDGGRHDDDGHADDDPVEDEDYVLDEHPDGHPDDAPDALGQAPLGAPTGDSPDVDGVAGGVSGPPSGGRPRLRSDRPRSQQRRESAAAVQANVPAGLQLAAAWAWRVLVVLTAVFSLVWAAAYVAVVVVPVLVALLLAALLQPGAAALVHRRWPRPLAAAAMLVVGLGVFAGIITLVVEQISAGFADLSSQVSQGIDRVRSFIVATFPITHGELNAAVTQFQNSLLKNRSTLATGALTTALTVGEVVTGLLLTLFTLFFFLKDGRTIWLGLIGLLPRDSRAYADEAGRRSWRTLISYVRATAAVALIDAVGIGIGLAVLRVPLVVPLAALVFLGAFIPILGSFLAGSVAVLVALVSRGPVAALIALTVVVLVMQLEGHVLQPLLLGRAVRVHPLAVVLSIAAGLLVGGVFGALIAVPMVACGNVAGTYLSRRHEGPRPPEPRPERARPMVGVS